MKFETLSIKPMHDDMTITINAGILVRKHNTDELSYYLENDDDMLEVVYREKKLCDGVLSGCIMKPYTWAYETTYPVLFGDEKKFEDPRLWLYKNKSHISFTYYPLVLFGEYSMNKTIDKIIHLPIGNNTTSGLEKNWGFFEHEGRLCMVYYPSPLVIIEMENNIDNLNIVNISETICPQLGIGVCGGSPPILHPHEKIYYIFVHKTIIKDNYNIWCIAFTKTNDNKWNIKGFTKERLNDGNPSVISYVNGSIYDKQKDQWILSGGHNDQVLAFWILPHDELTSKMTWLF